MILQNWCIGYDFGQFSVTMYLTDYRIKLTGDRDETAKVIEALVISRGSEVCNGVCR